MRRAGQDQAALAIEKNHLGKQTMDAIRDEIDLLSNAAGRAEVANEQTAWFGTALAAVGGLGLLGFGLMSATGLFKTLDALAASEERLLITNLALETHAEERTRQLETNEARLRNYLTTLNLGTFMIRDFEGTIRFWSEGCTRLYGWAAEEAVGRLSHELLQTKFPMPLAEVEALLQRDGAWTGDLLHRARDGREVIVTAHKVLGREGERIQVLEAVTEVTEVRRSDRERRRADALLRGVITAAPGLIYAKDRQGRLLLANEAVTTLVGKPWDQVEGLTDLDFLKDRSQAEAVTANDREVMDRGETQELEELVGVQDGQPRVWLSTKTPLRSVSGEVEGLVGVSVEITDRKRTEARLRLVIHELNHRVKNTLATVQSIATQTLRYSEPVVRDALDNRLQSLASTHELLTREGWEGAELQDLVSAALEPYGLDQSGRFVVSGPRVRLLPRAAIAISMALHELATNALKYGSLSEQAVDGRVDVQWTTAEARFRLTWSESGGPRVVAPTRRGFGSRLIERILAQDLRGTAQMSFAEGGVTCMVDTVLEEIVVSPEAVELPMVAAEARS